MLVARFANYEKHLTYYHENKKHRFWKCYFRSAMRKLNRSGAGTNFAKTSQSCYYG